TTVAVVKPVADGKENDSAISPPALKLGAKGRRATGGKRKAKEMTETTGPEGGEEGEASSDGPKPAKKRKENRLPAEPKELIAARKPTRNVAPPVRFIEEHSNRAEVSKKSGGGKKKK
ncbi:hypothetical protein V5O48_019703, partial [Marasmius crinis-equi]